MGIARSFAKNVFFKGLGEVLIRLLSFAFIVLVARSVGENDFGALNFAFSFALLFVVIVDFGLNPLLVRDAAKNTAQTAMIFWNLLVIKAGLAVLFILAVIIGLRILAPTPEMTRLVYWMAAFVMLNSFTEFGNAVFHAHQKMQYEAGIMALQKLGLVLFGVVALGWGWGIKGVAAAYVAAGGLALTTGMAFLISSRSFLRQPWRLNPSFLTYALRQALPLTLTTLFINIYFRIDMTLLAKMRPPAEVGWYGAAHKCIEFLMVVPAILVVSSFPGFSKLFHEDRDKMARAAGKVLRLLLLLGAPIVGGALIMAKPLMILFFGEAYAPAGGALVWLSLALGCIYLNYALSFLLISGGRQKVNAVISGIAVLISVGANLLFIPAYGYLGAALSALLTELFLLAAYYTCARRMLFALPLLAPALRISLAVGVMMGVVWLLRHLHPLAVVAAGAAVYGGAAVLLKAVAADDMDILRRIFQRG
ncbi:flippase [candidate division FCPU426 bacterium]|nr:flippase [candidate division FCPU426 bacterium]